MRFHNLSFGKGYEIAKHIVQNTTLRKLGFEYRDGRMYFDVDRIDIHSVIEVVL